jgi:muramoyltetrapeptide carboxypeptidase
MTRRAALFTPLAALAQTRPIVKPRALREGDTVGLVTPATYVADPDRIALAERTLKYFGLRARFGRNVRRRSGYLGGTVAERVADLHELFADPEIKGIFCLRGGYGSGQLLDKLDYGLIRRNPKVFLGYSDITSLHLAIHRETGLVTFHGPVVVSAFTEYTQKYFRAALFSTDPIGRVTNPPDPNALRPRHSLRTVHAGSARGRLIGGNLSLVSALMGTRWEIDTRGRMLFLEDVGEQPYAIDRMLTQLRLAGKLDAASGIVFGECSDCKPREFQPSFESTFSLGEVVDAILGEVKKPVLYGLTIGHTDDQLTLPIGVEATLDADKGELIIEESAVQ